MITDILSELTSKDDKSACALAEKIVEESRDSDKWYPYFAEFASLISHPKSLVRNRAFSLLAANAKWDGSNLLKSILPELLSHITDEKPISARQCVKALGIIGRDKPLYIPEIIAAFDSADLSKYKDSMRPLIEKDIADAKELFKH